MTTLRPQTFSHRLCVWLLAVLVLWGAAAPVLMRLQPALADVVGMEVCSAMLGGTQAKFAPPANSSRHDTDRLAQCPWCLLVLTLGQALPAQVEVAVLALLPQAAPSVDHAIPVAPSTWVLLPPPRGPPAAQVI